MKKYFVILVFGFALLSSCHKEDTSWNSDWVAPIVNDTLSLKNLVNDSTLVSNVSSFYELDLSRTILNLGIEDIVAIPDTVISQNYSIVVPSISVPPGFSIVNQVEEHTIDLEPIQLKKIRVSQGTIKLKVYNPLQVQVYFTIQLPGVSKNGVLFEQNYLAPVPTVSNAGETIAILDISGYDMDLTGETGGGVNILQSKLIIKTDPLGPSVTVTSANVFKIDAEFKNIKIDYARGYFGNKIISDTTSMTLELLNAVTAGSIDLPACSVGFEITNGMKAEARATITKVSNTNYAGNTVDLSGSNIGVAHYIDPATGTWNTLSNSVQSFTFNSGNSNIEPFLENLGKLQTVGYKIELNPWGNTSGGWNEIFPNSRLKVKLKAQMPLAIGADGLTLKDTFDLDFSQDLTKSHVESGSFVLNTSNAFPFSSSVKLYLMNANGTVLHTIVGSSDIISSLYGAIDPADGMKKMNSEIVFILNEAVLTDLVNITKVAVETEFNTPDPTNGLNQQVLIPSGAFIAVKLKAKLNLKAIY